MFFSTNKKEECCGCRSCINACPKAAIEMKEDKEGFFYPVKNENCNNCGLCVKVCPYNFINTEKMDNSSYPISYAAYGEKDRIGSSSGGLFYAFAKEIIARKGCVYGAAFDENLKLKHIRVDTYEGLEALRGAKYLQSNIGYTYKDVKAQLDNDRYVFFSGTPCQIAGLKSFLQTDYNKLLTADLICHGVPNQFIFDEHRKYLENKYHSQLVNYQFRDNQGWGGCEICSFISQKNHKYKQIKVPSYELSPFLYSFMHGFTYRLSCYECPFAKIPRQGDITLGDYWGIEHFFPKLDSSKGVSALLINNTKAEKIWDCIRDTLVIEKSQYLDIGKYNKNLVEHTNKPKIRNSIYKDIINHGYPIIAKKKFRGKDYKIRYLKYRIKSISFARKIIELIKK